jgi:hypothetical protein
MSLKVYIPDVQNPLDIPNEDLTIDEVRDSLMTLYPVVEDAPATRNGNVITFSRSVGGSKA